ncbi:hypothetical protein AAG570_004614 [Ranatra chinensis]|uniref:non-specific serine/threonine protein kinase n=1 Tax=Ranatra chinensis TaxID=642074 RepID=A0ABD0YE00_9HEMI
MFCSCCSLTLYIGEHKHGLYALPSFAGRDLPLLPLDNRPPRLLIEGPNSTGTENQIILLGHYKVPDTSKTLLQIAGRSDPVILPNSTPSTPEQTKDEGTNKVGEYSAKLTNGSVEFQLLSLIVAGLAVTLVVMFLYFRAKVRDIQLSSQGSSQGSSYGKSSSTEDTQYGLITVGKISFNTQYILGKGCEGTFVFRGEFDGRRVAVKRLLPDCFTVADREVCLLRESDAHPNVVRYFCMEQDSQFRYIALELCSATVQGYVEKGLHRDEIEATELLKQASMGLGHLHSLNIVHRDIKPHNILLSVNQSQVRAMISDFGLCKKLQNGRMSFSRRSGITGTDGWIAPEMIESTGRTMCAVDIFSLGCVFYYVLSNGKHPFGESIRRQANILSGEYRLSALEDELWKMLVDKMISQDPLKRPSIEVIKKHPVFWEKSVILTFLQDVSDRIEKEDLESDIVLNLERGAGRAIGGADWRDLIDCEVAEDLRKYRSYKGGSIRDLLRAIRNKKHHYRELTAEAQRLLGADSETYLAYWTSHFPALLDHTWVAMQAVRDESAFRNYYHSSYTFPRVEDDNLNPFPLSAFSIKEMATPLANVWKRPVAKTPESARRTGSNWFGKGPSGGPWKSRGLSKFRQKRKEKKDDGLENIVWRLSPES